MTGRWHPIFKARKADRTFALRTERAERHKECSVYGCPRIATSFCGDSQHGYLQFCKNHQEECKTITLFFHHLRYKGRS